MMIVRPAECHLEDVVKLVQRGVAGNKHPTPHSRLHVGEREAQLKNVARWSLRAEAVAIGRWM
jgi:hypothetical protein